MKKVFEISGFEAFSFASLGHRLLSKEKSQFTVDKTVEPIFYNKFCANL